MLHLIKPFELCLPVCYSLLNPEMIWKSHLCFLKKLFSLSEKAEFKGGCTRKKKGKLGHHFYYSVLFSSHCCWGALYPLWWKRNSVFLLAKSWWWPAGVENVGIGQVGCAGHDWRGSRKKMGVWLQREVRQGWCSPPYWDTMAPRGEHCKKGRVWNRRMESASRNVAQVVQTGDTKLLGEKKQSEMENDWRKRENGGEGTNPVCASSRRYFCVYKKLCEVKHTLFLEQTSVESAQHSYFVKIIPQKLCPLLSPNAVHSSTVQCVVKRRVVAQLP